MTKRFFLPCLTAAFLVSPAVCAEDMSLDHVVFRGLDKTTGRLSMMTVKVGEKTQFGALDIYARVCFARPPEEPPENSAYLQIVEKKPEGQLKLFSGWMFSSSPALSAMEHPVYDVWVVQCQGEQVRPPAPEPLILENPIEVKQNLLKVKVTADGVLKPQEAEKLSDDQDNGEAEFSETPESLESPGASQAGTVDPVIPQEEKPQPIIVIQPKETKEKSYHSDEDGKIISGDDPFGDSAVDSQPGNGGWDATTSVSEESYEGNQEPLLRPLPKTERITVTVDETADEAPVQETEEVLPDSYIPED